MNIHNKVCVAVFAIALVFIGASRSRAADDFVYRSPAGVAFHVNDKGLSSITYNNREIAGGRWHVINAESWFKDGGSNAVKADVKDQALAVVDDHHARVVQGGGDLNCTFDYTFAGDDVLISTHIENHHVSEPMNIVGFEGLTFHFDRLPTGLMPVQHITYFQAHGVQLCHPGYWEPIGGTYAADDSIGIGTSPANTGLMRTLTLWDYADWNADKREHDPHRQLRYFAVNTIPPRGAATIDFVLRVSPDRDWKNLLTPYREHFQKTFGPVQYKADNRWIATDYLNESQQAISPANPYGFHPGARRIDTADGVKLFCDNYIPAIKQANGQGIIVWGQGGDDPRGGMYRPDFDVLPPEVEQHWQTIADRFKAAGLNIGVATRPRDMAVRADWKTDEIISINPDDAGHREMLLRRFQHMQKLGCSLFYLDSFGDSFEDVKLMRFLREKLGPNVLTFCEHQCDAIMPYSGGYSETTYDDSGAIVLQQKTRIIADSIKMGRHHLSAEDLEKALTDKQVDATPKSEEAAEKLRRTIIRADADGVLRLEDVARVEVAPQHDPYRLWSGMENWQIYQWLCPGSQMAGRLYEIKGKLPADDSTEVWYYGHHITPLVPTDQFQQRLKNLENVQAKHIDDTCKWKE